MGTPRKYKTDKMYLELLALITIISPKKTGRLQVPRNVLRPLLIVDQINSSGRYINLTNVKNWIERFDGPDKYYTKARRMIKILKEEKLIEKINIKRSKFERQHYQLTTEAAILLDRLRDAIDRLLKSYNEY